MIRRPLPWGAVARKPPPVTVDRFESRSAGAYIIDISSSRLLVKTPRTAENPLNDRHVDHRIAGVTGFLCAASQRRREVEAKRIDSRGAAAW